MNNATRIHATKIIGTNRVILSAWEPDAGHSTTMHLDGIRYGRIGCRKLPGTLEALPAMSAIRSELVRGWHQAQYEEAYAAIIAERPDVAGGERSMGEIEVVDGDGEIARGADFNADVALAELVGYLRAAGLDVADTGVVRGTRYGVRVYPKHNGTVALVEQVHSAPAGRRIVRPRGGASARARVLGELLGLGA
jgi:hypothetical protein